MLAALVLPVALLLEANLLLAVLDDLLADLVLLATRLGPGALAAVGLVLGALLPLLLVGLRAAVVAVLAVGVEVLPGVDAEEVDQGSEDVTGAVGEVLRDDI